MKHLIIYAAPLFSATDALKPWYLNFNTMKHINLTINIILVFACFIANRISSQDLLNMKISFDSVSTTIFSQEKIDVQLDYSDSTDIKYYSGVSGVEIDFGTGSWMLHKNQITSSFDEPSYILKNMYQFINLPGLFCSDTLLFNSIKNTGCEIKLRFRLYCSIDSSPFEYRYSGTKKMVLPPANSDDINALTFLTEHGIDCDFFSWLHNFPEETETTFTYIKDNFPNSVLSDLAKYHAIKLELSRDYYEDNIYSEDVINKAKNTFNSLLNSKAQYLRIFAQNKLNN